MYSLPSQVRICVDICFSMVVDNPSDSSDSIHQFVKTHIPEAKLGRIHGKEVDITLPLTSADKFAGNGAISMICSMKVKHEWTLLYIFQIKSCDVTVKIYPQTTMSLL